LVPLCSAAATIFALVFSRLSWPLAELFQISLSGRLISVYHDGWLVPWHEFNAALVRTEFFCELFAVQKTNVGILKRPSQEFCAVQKLNGSVRAITFDYCFETVSILRPLFSFSFKDISLNARLPGTQRFRARPGMSADSQRAGELFEQAVPLGPEERRAPSWQEIAAAENSSADHPGTSKQNERTSK
jgi:hypothetical protein